MRRNSAFWRFVYRNDFHRESFAPLSCVSMDGGRLYVPQARYRSEFLVAYARALEDGESLFLVERPCARMKFYADFDLVLCRTADSDDYVHKLSEAFVVALRDRAGVKSRLLVLRAAPKPLDEETCKIGVHVICIDTEVTVQDAEAFRERVLPALADLAPPRNGWDDGFDGSVYRQGGLRMVGSKKMVPCGCKSSSAPCPHPVGKVDAGRPYMLFGAYSSSGEFDKGTTDLLRRNMTSLVMWSSIRISDDDAGFAEGPRKRMRHANMLGAASNDATRLSAFVVGLLPPHKDLHVVDIARRSDDRAFLRVEGPGMRFCPHVHREHASSTLYFVVDDTGVACRCHCAKYGCARFSKRFGATPRAAALLGRRPGAPPLGFAR